MPKRYPNMATPVSKVFFRRMRPVPADLWRLVLHTCKVQRGGAVVQGGVRRRIRVLM
jgi:hypothetical protein